MTDDPGKAMDDKAVQQAMNSAVRILSARNHTRKELERKLRKRKYAQTLIDRVIAECERLNYIDDIESAKLYARQLSEKGYGSKRVKMALRKKGIASDLMESALSEETEDKELEAARKAMSRKLIGLQRESDPRKKKEKLFRFLYSRGFASSVISKVMSEDRNR